MLRGLACGQRSYAQMRDSEREYVPVVCSKGCLASARLEKGAA